MSTTTSATVEVLAAEVRVLMVGSRQVTLSIARQLDRVDLAEMEPFGRVKFVKDCPETVIGVSRSGQLCVAEYRKYEGWPWVWVPDGAPRITLCRRTRPAYGGEFELRFRGRVVKIDEHSVAQCGYEEHGRYVGGECEHWLSNGNEAVFTQQIADFDADWARHQAAAALPLIVLAGLK